MDGRCRHRIYGLVTAAILLCATTVAQTVVPKLVLDTNVLQIGEQTQIHLSVTYRVDAGGVQITWPTIADTLTKQIEVVSDSGVDTLMVTPDKDEYLFRQERRLTITSFDSGYWAIPPFKFHINEDSAETQPLLIEVRTVEVDTSQAFKDIKDIYELPFSWKYWVSQNWPWVAGGAGALAVIAALVMLAKRKKEQPVIVPQQPVLPLHVRTLTALEELDKKKIWQQGHHKKYHSELTDILRGYVEERFNVHALEKTTDELVRELKLSSMKSDQREVLKNTLELADLVKFAKMTPISTENEAVMQNSIRIVRETSQTDPVSISPSNG